MSAVTEPQVRAREAAIALNNVGVSFLERRRYHLAMDTFKDSLDIMRASFVATEEQQEQSIAKVTTAALTSSGEWNASPAEFEVDEPLHKASKSLARSSSALYFAEQDDAHLNAVSDDISPEAILVIAHQVGGHHQYNPYAIRIHTNIDMFVSDFDVETALILFNYGVANQLYSQECCCPVQSSNALHGASKLFHLAHIILSQISLENLEEVDVWKFLLTSLLVLENLIQICNEFDLIEQGEIYYDQLSNLQCHISEQIQPEATCNSWEYMSRNPAAAA
jgi:hypothetical protein